MYQAGGALCCCTSATAPQMLAAVAAGRCQLVGTSCTHGAHPAHDASKSRLAEEAEDDMDEEELLLARMDAGLFTLQQVGRVHLLTSPGVPGGGPPLFTRLVRAGRRGMQACCACVQPFWHTLA